MLMPKYFAELWCNGNVRHRWVGVISHWSDVVCWLTRVEDRCKLIIKDLRFAFWVRVSDAI